MKFQEHQHDKKLGSTIDAGTNRIALDGQVMREFVRDNTLKTWFRNRIVGIEKLLVPEAKEQEDNGI